MKTLMTHMIPFYPNKDLSMEAAKAMVKGGARYIEVQFPFSDPTADGPTIEAACTKALSMGFTVNQGFEFVRELHDWIQAQKSQAEIFIMSYASLVYARGIPKFVLDAKQSGATGLIVPDLPPDSDEGFYHACTHEGVHGIPVLVPFMEPGRLDLVLSSKPAFVYCALRAGITGVDTALDSKTLDFLARAGAKGARVLGGFGITTPQQVQQLAPHVHACVIGSALVRAIDQHITKDLGKNIQEIVQKLGTFA